MDKEEKKGKQFIEYIEEQYDDIEDIYCLNNEDDIADLKHEKSRYYYLCGEGLPFCHKEDYLTKLNKTLLYGVPLKVYKFNSEQMNKILPEEDGLWNFDSHFLIALFGKDYINEHLC